MPTNYRPREPEYYLNRTRYWAQKFVSLGVR